MTRKFSSISLIVLSAFIGAFSGIVINKANPSASALSEAEVREIIKDEVSNDPKFVLEAIQGYMDAKQAAEVKMQDLKVLEFKDRLEASGGRPFTGNSSGAVELVYFFDVNCVFCKKIDPVLKRIADENDDVRISHREIPILAESSRLAAVYSNIVWELFPEKYPAIHDAFLSHSGALTGPEIEEKLVDILGPSDAVDVISAGSSNSSEMARKSNALIEENLQLARDAGITGTPFVFVVQVGE